MKSVKRIFTSIRPHWVGDGFFVSSVFNQQAFTNEVSPFLLFDYGVPKRFDPSDQKRGVKQHPHRGMETVSIAYQGSVAHRDSKGHSGVVNPGDVQWMTAGSGIVHEEYHSDEFTQKGGVFEMAQLWVNLPKRHKMIQPRYQAIKNDDIPLVPLSGDAGDVRVIAGDYAGHKGPALTFTPINIWDLRLKGSTTATFSVPPGHNTMLFVRKGRVLVGGETAQNTTELSVAQCAQLSFEGKEFQVTNKAGEEALLLLLGGEPLNEPIAKKGNFVMNTQEEIEQAQLDYKEGRLGTHFE